VKVVLSDIQPNESEGAAAERRQKPPVRKDRAAIGIAV